MSRHRRKQKNPALIGFLVVGLVVVVGGTWAWLRFNSEGLASDADESLVVLDTNNLDPTAVRQFNGFQIENVVNPKMPPDIDPDQVVNGSIKYKLNSLQLLSSAESADAARVGSDLVASPLLPGTLVIAHPTEATYQVKRSYLTLLFPQNPDKLPIASATLVFQTLCSNQEGAIALYQGNWPLTEVIDYSQLWQSYQGSAMAQIPFSQDCDSVQTHEFPLATTYDELAGTVAKIVFIDQHEDELFGQTQVERLQSSSLDSYLELKLEKPIEL